MHSGEKSTIDTFNKETQEKRINAALTQGTLEKKMINCTFKNSHWRKEISMSHLTKPPWTKKDKWQI